MEPYENVTEVTKEDTMQTTIVQKNTAVIAVTAVDVWVIKQDTTYSHTETKDYPYGEEGIESELDPLNEPEPEGDYGTWRTNRRQYQYEEIITKKWQRGATTTDIYADEFLGLWSNKFGVHIKGSKFVPQKEGGKLVEYKVPIRDKEAPIKILKGGGMDWLCSFLANGDNVEGTQKIELLLRYLMKLYEKGITKDYSLLGFDLSIFETEEFSLISSDVVGGNVQEKVWFSLRNMGFSEYAVAGAMGNIDYESGGFNPSSIEGGTGKGIGLCQWTGDRREGLEAYAIAKETTWQDVDTQVEFLMAELTKGGGAGGKAKYQLMSAEGYKPDDWINAQSVDVATEAFCYTFERPDLAAAQSSMAYRKAAAQRYYSLYSGKTMSSGDENTGSIGDGYESTFSFGGKEYKQYKQTRGAYKTVKFGNGTVSSSGCGPTSVAIILSGYGINADPGDVATTMMNNKYKESSGESIRWAFSAYGLSSHTIYGVRKEDLKNHLSQGKPVVVSVNNNLNGMFTNGGHLMAILGINEKDEVYVSNPNPGTKTGWCPIDDIITCSASKYAIYVDQ